MCNFVYFCVLMWYFAAFWRNKRWFIRAVLLPRHIEITRMHGSAIRCVRSHHQSMEKRKIRPPVNTKWQKIFKRRADYMITSWTWVSVQNSNEIGSPNFVGEIFEVWVFFSHTQSNTISSRTGRKYGRVWNIYGSKRVASSSRLDAPFRGSVYDKSF